MSLPPAAALFPAAAAWLPTRQANWKDLVLVPYQDCVVVVVVVVEPL